MVEAQEDVLDAEPQIGGGALPGRTVGAKHDRRLARCQTQGGDRTVGGCDPHQHIRHGGGQTQDLQPPPGEAARAVERPAAGLRGVDIPARPLADGVAG